MRKYIGVFATTFKSQLAFRFDVYMGFLFSLSRALLAYILWGAIFSGRETVGGFTLDEMITYYILNNFFRSMDFSDSGGGEFAYRIRQGLFSSFMTRPEDVQCHFFAMNFGASAYYSIFQLLSAALWVLVFGLRFAFKCTLTDALSAFALVLMGLVFMGALNFSISMLAFKYGDTDSFIRVKNNIISLITGSLIPLSLMPDVVVTVMRFTPFYYSAYLPSMLLMGKGSGEAVLGMAIVAAWSLVFIVLGRRAYSKYRVMYDGVGI